MKLSSDDVPESQVRLPDPFEVAGSEARMLQPQELANALAIAWHELDRLRRVVAERSEQLAAVQTELYHARRNADLPAGSNEQVSRLENELNALRYRLDQSEATLARFRRSFSWRVTRPLRWIGRNFGLNGRRPQR